MRPPAPLLAWSLIACRAAHPSPDGGAADAPAPTLADGGPGAADAPIGDGAPAAAAHAAATDPACTQLGTPFYWEIGDADGPLASGTGGAPGTVDPQSPMLIASASKLLFGAYALETRTLDDIVAAGDDAYLHFTSGYVNLSDLACDISNTVSACFNAGAGDTTTASAVGHFYYQSGHLQAYAVNAAHLGDELWSNTTRTPRLADDVQAVIGAIGLTYPSPLLAGGGKVSPAGYAQFLRKILAGQLSIHDHLGERAVCAWTHHDDCDAQYSPVNESRPGVATNDVSDYRWHYSLAHWVEDDGTFSSPGAFGFYPWIDASKRYYGLVAREDHTAGAYFASVVCGRAIRAAWLAP
jgi:hypothetical protein